MLIGIERTAIKNIGSFISYLESTYEDKIEKIIRGGSRIRLINGDIIIIINYIADGLRTDVAIGEEAAVHLTRFSEEEKPIWTLEDLENHLNNIEAGKREDRNSISIKVSVDTTEIDEALAKANELVEVLERISKLSENVEGLNKLTNTIRRMSLETKEHWFKDIERIARISQPSYERPARNE